MCEITSPTSPIICGCGWAYYCSTSCKEDDLHKHSVICEKMSKKKGVEVVKECGQSRMYGEQFTTHFSGLKKGKVFQFGTLEYYETGCVYKGQIEVRKHNGICIVVPHGIGVMRSKTNIIHVGSFRDAHRFGLGMAVCELENSKKCMSFWKTDTQLFSMFEDEWYLSGPVSHFNTKRFSELNDEYSDVVSIRIPHDSIIKYQKNKDFLAYKVPRGLGFEKGECVVMDPYCTDKMGSIIIRKELHPNDISCEIYLMWTIDEEDEEGFECLSAKAIMKKKDVFYALYVGKGCHVHGNGAFTWSLHMDDVTEDFEHVCNSSEDKIDKKTACTCHIVKEEEKVIPKCEPVSTYVKFEEDDVVIQNKTKRRNLTEDLDSSLGSIEEGSLPGIRGVSRRDMGDSNVSSSNTCQKLGHKLRDLLVDNKWTLVRNRNHMVYRRKVVKDGKSSTQNFVCATTPSAWKSDRYSAANLRNLNRGVDKFDWIGDN